MKRYEREMTIWDCMMETLSEEKERSQASPVLPGEPNGEPHMMNKPKSWDSVKERKFQRLMHEYTTHS